MEKKLDSCPIASSPAVVFHHGKNERSQTFFSLSDERYYVKKTPTEMREQHCCRCSNGWLLMKSIYSDECRLYNPISKDKIELPLVELDSRTFGFIISPPPCSTNDLKNCAVVFLSERRSHLVYKLCRPGIHDRWIERDLGPKKETNHELHEMLMDATVCKEKIYVYFTDGRIGIIDVLQDYVTLKFITEVNRPNSRSWTYTFSRDYMLESCGEVYMVMIGHLNSNVIQTTQVLKLIMTEEGVVWSEVTTLGDRIFLLHSYYGYSVSAKDLGIQGNCIYYLCEEDRSLYKFDMENESLCVTLPCPNVVRQWSTPYWFIPST